MDITVLNEKAYLLLVIDLGSKLVVAHAFQNRRFTTKDVIQALKNTLLKRTEDRTIILHSDCESIFKSAEMLAFAKDNQIALSHNLAGYQRFGNQVSESLNRSIKLILRKKVIAFIGQKPSKRKTSLQKYSLKQITNLVSFDELSACLNESLLHYNNKPHTSDNMFALSPFNMDEILYNDQQKQYYTIKPTIVKNDNSKESLEVRKARALLAESYVFNWQAILLEHKRTSEKTLNEVQEANKKLTLVQHMLYEDNRRLKEHNEQLNKKIDYLVQETKARAEKDAAKETARAKRRSAKKQKLRDTVSPADFQIVLNLVEDTYKEDHYVIIKARIRVAFILLYITGLRVSNLLLLSWNQLLQLLHEGETELLRIKGGGRAPKKLYLGSQGKTILKQFKNEIHILKDTSSFSLDHPVFTAQRQFTKNYQSTPLNRENFNKQLNNILKKASVVLKKNIKTHSFRATFITELLEADTPIHKVKALIGHKRIEATAAYDRTTLSSQEIKKTLAKINKARLTKFQVVKRTKRPKQKRKNN